MSRQLNSLTNQLHDSGTLKVWSLIITFFGDSIVSRGGNVAASTVQTVLDRIDIGDGAVRTAFSRLASDGWVERERRGRRSFYQLTQDGEAPFLRAAQRIYSPAVTETDSDGTWLLGIHHDKTALNELPLTNVSRLPGRTVLLYEPDESTLQILSSRGFLTITGQCSEVPDWVVQHLCPADWTKHVELLQKNFSKLSKNPPTDPLSALAARTLLIHQWRRLLLRYPPIPDVLKGDALQIENNCREFVADLYHQLTVPAENWLNEFGLTVSGDMPDAKTDPANRFTLRFSTLQSL